MGRFSIKNTWYRIDGGYSRIGDEGFFSHGEDVPVPASHPGNLEKGNIWKEIGLGQVFHVSISRQGYAKPLLKEKLTHFMQSLWTTNALDFGVDISPPFDNDSFQLCYEPSLGWKDSSDESPIFLSTSSLFIVCHKAGLSELTANLVIAWHCKHSGNPMCKYICSIPRK